MADVAALAGAPISVDPDGDAWLRGLARALRPEEHLFGAAHLDGPLLVRADDGSWHAGAVIGELWLGGRRLLIGAPGHPAAAEVLAALWCSAVESATRHGPPAVRQDVPHVGASLRGRLDVRRSVRLRAAGSSNIASIYRARDLRNDISRALVAADRALRRQMGHDRWRSRRVREVMPQLHEAVGRDRPPTLAELARIPYTPITRPFRDVAELSVRIVLQDPLLTSTERGRPQGVIVPLSVASSLTPVAA